MNLIFGNFVVGTSVINRFCQLDSFDRYGFQTNREISAFKQKTNSGFPVMCARGRHALYSGAFHVDASDFYKHQDGSGECSDKRKEKISNVH